MKVTTVMLSDFFSLREITRRVIKTLRVIYRIERDNISYSELIEYLYGETPPENYDFLNYDYSPFIESIVKFGFKKNNPPLFSVIIATYNRHEPLLKTISAI